MVCLARGRFFSILPVLGSGMAPRLMKADELREKKREEKVIPEAASSEALSASDAGLLGRLLKGLFSRRRLGCPFGPRLLPDFGLLLLIQVDEIAGLRQYSLYLRPQPCLPPGILRSLYLDDALSS